MLLRLPENGGIVMVVALPGFLNEERREWFAAREAEEARLASLFQGQPAIVEAAMAEWDEANPEPATTIGHMADHIDHIQVIIHPDDRNLYDDAVGDLDLPEPVAGDPPVRAEK